MSDEQAIGEVVQALEQAINMRDWAGFASNFAPDADLIVFESPRAVGRQAAREMMEQGWTEMPADVRGSLSLDSVRFISPEFAVANIDAEFTITTHPRDRATALLSRDGDRWMIEAFRVIQAQGTASL